MKRNVYLQLVVIGLIFLLSSVSGCQKNETVSDELKCPIQGIDGLKDNIVGKWKVQHRFPELTGAIARCGTTLEFTNGSRAG
ncbi:MAG TPA: hypothetical protein VNQ55_02070 [Parapedobacter sp.]|nr:hypothetical protein [Parapedobacter sp.]